jgi:hypothetical protein
MAHRITLQGVDDDAFAEQSGYFVGNQHMSVGNRPCRFSPYGRKVRPMQIDMKARLA